MRDRNSPLFVINDEKYLTVIFPEVRVGPPESCFRVKKVSENTFSASIIRKKAV